MSLDPVTYVESIELDDHPWPPQIAIPDALKCMTRADLPYRADNKQEGNVVAGSIVAFTSGVKGQAKQDILDATLFAQLAANKVHNREAHPIEWYKKYVDVLENIGFVISSFDWNKYNSSGSTLSMDKSAIEILKAAATRSATLAATAALDALGKLPGDDYSVKLFEDQASSSSQGNFQIGVCDQTSDGTVSFSLGAFHFSANKHVTRFLWFTWGTSSIDLHLASQALVFNASVYGQVRSTIVNKLGNKAVTYVASIEI